MATSPLRIVQQLVSPWQLLLVLLLGTCARGRRDDLIINTDKGRVRGIRYYLPTLGKAVDAYLGIPFAQPPVGHLRFRHPQPRDPWKGIYNASKLPSSCYQPVDLNFGPEFHGSNMWNPPTPISEDCLYINVWIPKTHPRIRNSAVMIWIYGGGFYGGTTTLKLYDGKILAALNNIIVVSVAYRVGAFGFASLGYSGMPGNMGMFDQLMGLEWVQQNIKAFGGDPDNVTLFGESAGSVSVSLHLFSPLSRSKFHRVIMQSGTANMPWGTYTMREAQRRTLVMAHTEIRCPKTDSMDKVALCLRSTPPQKLVENQWVSRGVMQFPYLPVIDGTFLIESPEVSLQRGNFKKCPILLGTNANEGSWFLVYELTDFLSLEKKSMTLEQFHTSIGILFHRYPQFPATLNPFGQDAILYQYTNWDSPHDEMANIRSLDQALSDSHFQCHVNKFAGTYSAAGENVYTYYFTHRYTLNPWPSWMGVMHGDEIMFMFGEALKPGLNYTEDERELSRQIMRYWTNFAKTGDPNRAPGQRPLDEWPLHTPAGREYLELSVPHLRAADKSQAVGRGPRIRQCAFWQEYLPQLVAGTENINVVEKRWKMEFHEWSTKYIVDWKVKYDKWVRDNEGEENCSGDDGGT